MTQNTAIDVENLYILMSSKKPLLICVVGPTAIGKTALAIEIARAFSTEIVSADSRQFFQEMNIGTAVPSVEELALVPHHFIQQISITENYSVGDFERDALQTLDTLFKKKDVAVMVGGSGLYVDAVVKGLDTFPEVPSEIRNQLTKELEENGLEALQKELEKVDPTYYKTIDFQNPRRITRALEIYRTTGNPYSTYIRSKPAARNFNTIYIGIRADRKIIYDRINQRVDIMMDHGLLNEAEKLYEHRDLNALQTVGYRELFQYFDGAFSLAEAVSEIKKNTRRFAKRQLTWLRKNEAIHWIDFPVHVSEVITQIKAKNTL
ncbi:tRNA (adenosine(37)-N6)-dimethylallyltransferase MiaA [Jejudonia soesokkakensis]|uniref:tRNA dimethylallyltransferase n=1 Tax=Jejudonia soesokkakensis TaxID=1323432 RepID=A0ABW2MUD3_9FLAO